MKTSGEASSGLVGGGGKGLEWSCWEGGEGRGIVSLTRLLAGMPLVFAACLHVLPQLNGQLRRPSWNSLVELSLDMT